MSLNGLQHKGQLELLLSLEAGYRLLSIGTMEDRQESTWPPIRRTSRANFALGGHFRLRLEESN